jgi:putative redox protein
MLTGTARRLVIGASHACHLLRHPFRHWALLFRDAGNARSFLQASCYAFHALRSLYPGGRMHTAFVAWIGEQKFVATSPSGHAMVFDSDRQSNQAPGSMEMLLMALGACTATDVVIVLQKKRQKLESLEVICSGERAENPPQVWVKLEMLYRLRGNLDEAAVKHAIELSEDKYCSVSAMLKKTAALTWRYEILPPTE